MFIYVFKYTIIFFVFISYTNTYENKRVSRGLKKYWLKPKKYLPIVFTNTNGTVIAVGRRLRDEVPPRLKNFDDRIQQYQHDGRDETYYEPYWNSGEWVFLRITTPKGGWKTKKTPGGPKVPGMTTKRFVKWPMSWYRDCDLYCLRIYSDVYGPVCGQRFDTVLWQYEYKNFTNMCELETTNCKSEEKLWYPIHKSSSCVELTTWKNIPSDFDEILARKSSLAPYEYLRTTTRRVTRSRPRRRRTTKSKG